MPKAAEVVKKMDNFVMFLHNRGAELLQPSGEYELMRFRTPRMTSIVYRNSDNTITFFGEAEEAWNAFKLGGKWRGYVGTRSRDRNPGDVDTLKKRDGDLCFFCLQELKDDITIEHLVARTHGGPNHISNKFLSHQLCNERAGSLSAAEKVKLHARKMVERVAEGMTNVFMKD